MQSSQTIGIDLPLKVLVWQDASGKTWLSYNDPSWLAKRHGLSLEVDPTVNVMDTGHSAIVRKANCTTVVVHGAAFRRVMTACPYPCLNSSCCGRSYALRPNRRLLYISVHSDPQTF
jgi:hypothetical protein